MSMHADIFRAYVRKMLRDEDEKRSFLIVLLREKKFKSEEEQKCAFYKMF